MDGLFPELTQARRRDQRLCKLLIRANSAPPSSVREEFYTLKRSILAEHAVSDGFDTQEIKRDCWGCDGTGTFRHWSRTSSDTCYRCGGSGIFRRDYWWLKRWQWFGHVFHTPIGQAQPTESPTIRGRIKHVDRCFAIEAAVAVMFMVDRPLFDRCVMSVWPKWSIVRRLLAKFDLTLPGDIEAVNPLPF